MAIYTNSQELSPLQRGGREAALVNTYSASSESGEAVQLEGNTATGNKGILSSLLIGSRSTSFLFCFGGSLNGSLVSTENQDPGRKYSLLKEIGNGIRETMMKPEDFYVFYAEEGIKDQKIYSGIGTFGVHYERTIVQPKEKQIRRWPRDWHGDNMTN